VLRYTVPTEHTTTILKWRESDSRPKYEFKKIQLNKIQGPETWYIATSLSNVLITKPKNVDLTPVAFTYFRNAFFVILHKADTFVLTFTYFLTNPLW
jgi:hypothetical protein